MALDGSRRDGSRRYVQSRAPVRARVFCFRDGAYPLSESRDFTRTPLTHQCLGRDEKARARLRIRSIPSNHPLISRQRPAVMIRQRLAPLTSFLTFAPLVFFFKFATRAASAARAFQLLPPRADEEVKGFKFADETENARRETR